MKTLPSTKTLSLLFKARKQAFLICTLSLIIASCNVPKKINHDVGTKFGGTVPAPSKKKSDYISITSHFRSMGDTFTVSVKKSSRVLPLLFYWQLDRKYICTLNPQIPVANFITTVTSYANKGLKQKLNGQRIELSLDKVPDTFEFYDKERMIWIVYGIAWYASIYTPENSDMVVSYKVFNPDNTVSKSGTISIAGTEKELSLGRRFQSLEKKTWKYLDEYTANITSMSKSVVDKIIGEL